VGLIHPLLAVGEMLFELLEVIPPLVSGVIPNGNDKMNTEKKGFTCGFVYALAELLRAGAQDYAEQEKFMDVLRQSQNRIYNKSFNPDA